MSSIGQDEPVQPSVSEALYSPSLPPSFIHAMISIPSLVSPLLTACLSVSALAALPGHRADCSRGCHRNLLLLPRREKLQDHGLIQEHGAAGW